MTPFVEAQTGMSAGNVNGNRFMLSAGHDFKLVTPFVQTLYKTLGNTGYYTTYAGVELDVLNHSTSEYTTSLNVKVKGGVNQRNAVGKLSAHGNLNLNNGTSFSTNLELNNSFNPKASVSFSYTH